MATPRAGRPRRWPGCALLALLPACQESSSSDPPPAPPEDEHVRISQPTTGPVYHAGASPVELAGEASIDAWNSYTRLVEPNVRWFNATTGQRGEAAESVDWIAFLFGFYPANHHWSASVPLAPGANDVRIEAYYSGSGQTVGTDSLEVWFP